MNDLSQRDHDLAAIRRLVAEAEEYQSDPARFIPLHTADVSVVNFGGRRVAGRESLARAMTAALASSLADVLTRTEIDDIRFIGPDTAIVACVKHVFDQREPSPDDDPGVRLPATRTGRLTYVVVRQLVGDEGQFDQAGDGSAAGSSWLISSAQTTPVMA
ncbi:SgcJ/EcaC family oxidoreductase [Kitasatospora sp. NBC_00085]|uniref:SgcJ/EcaC family oxidoreductase n=1 Tax=Kitasatospora sp. NBC_00085 TaxID=2903566 RepID=UPI00324BA0FC